MQKKAGMSSVRRRVTAMFLSVVLTIGLLPASVFAAEADYATVAGEEVITKKEALDLAKSLVTSAIKQDPKIAGQAVLVWGSGKLLDQVFGDVGGEKEATLADVLAAIQQLNTAIENLQSTINSQQLEGILNTLKPLLAKRVTYDVYKALRDINDKEASGEYSANEAKQLAQSELTDSLGNGHRLDVPSLATVGSEDSFDRFAELLWSAMAEPYHVTISGNVHDFDLMQVWYEYLRYKHHWEHQAYDEWASFQTRCISLLASTLALEKASLMTRIELIREWNLNHRDMLVSEGACVSRLETIQDRINQMSGYDGKGVNGEVVHYPGLFSESTWNRVYWLYKERDESERYYWTPGHEALFFAQVNTQDIPPELDGACLNESKNGGIEVTWTNPVYRTYSVRVRPMFWGEFLQYSGPGNNNTHLVSKDQLTDMFKDYKKDQTQERKHLYDIFIDPDKGNFLGLEEGDIESWWFVIDQDSDHKVYFKKEPWPVIKGTVRCYVLSSANAEEDTATLETYTASEAWRNKSRHFIGIGVKRYGPETLQSGGLTGGKESQMRVILDKTALTCNGKTQHPKVTVKYEGKTLKKSDYKVKYSKGCKIAGEYTVTVTGKSKDYKGMSATATFEIVKADNPLNLKLKKTPNVSFKKLSNKDQYVSLSKLFSVKKAKGKVTYTLEEADPGLSLDPKKKRIYLSKGLAEGTYKARISVSAAGTNRYEPATITETVTITVK